MAERNSYREWTRMDDVRLAELVAQGLPRANIAARLGRSDSAVGARIVRLGLAVDSRRPFSAADDAAIRTGRREGVTYAAIAQRLRRSEGAVKCRARRLGLAKGKRMSGDARVLVARKCLKHGGPFRPAHRLEFVCSACKEGEDWQAGAWMG